MKNERSISHRNFVKSASLAATAITTGLALKPGIGFAATVESQLVPANLMIGFQAEVKYLLQYGIERFLDDIQNCASVNTLMLHCNLFEPSWAGLDRASNPLSNFVTAHPRRERRI